MNGKDARSSARPGAWKQWIIGFIPGLALVAAAVAFRGANPPAEALAQAPAKSTPKRAASGGPAGFMARPNTPARQVAGPAAPQRSNASAGGASSGIAPVVRGTGAKTPPSVTTLSVVAVINGEQITKADLGRECLRRYGPEVLDNLLNKIGRAHV